MLLSYEIPMVISAAGVVIIAGSLSLIEVIQAQVIPNAIFQPLGFITFLVASTAELNRSPFDITEAESELVAGYMTQKWESTWIYGPYPLAYGLFLKPCSDFGH